MLWRASSLRRDKVASPNGPSGLSFDPRNDIDRRTAPAADVAVQPRHPNPESPGKVCEPDVAGRKVVGEPHTATFAPCEVSRQAKFRGEALPAISALRDTRRMPGPESDLHKHLRAWRKHMRLTLEHVANKIGSAQNTISGWETGDRTVDLDDLKRLADVYGVAPALLLYAPPGSAKLKALDELSGVMDGMEQEALTDLIRMAKRISTAPSV